jgi:hypothetical protein
VGTTLKTTFPTWNPTPTATGYRWSRDGAVIAGATHSTYTLTATDYGHDIWATILGSKDGYGTASRTKDLGVVARGTVRNVSTPVLHGTASIGGTLTVTTGGWSVSGLSVRYQWLRNGSIVSGKTTNSYAVTTADQGTTLAARIIVSKSGYTDASARSQVTGKIAVPAPAAPASASFQGDGVFPVGSRIQPGTYYSKNGSANGCYWARLNSSNTSDSDSINANDIGYGQRMMTVLASDKYVELEGCGSWYRIASAGPRLAHIPADGTYKVGQQVGPGTWQASFGSDGCYYALLSGTTGDFSQIITNDIFDGPGSVTVDITSDDYAFETSCGVWTKIG